MMRCLAVLFFLALSVAVHAAEPDDFAFGLKLSLPAPAPLYEVILPQRIYQGVTRPDLNDMRVFNQKGMEVPHLIRRPAPSQQSRLPLGLPIFALPANVVADAGNLMGHLQQNDRGAITGIINQIPMPNEPPAQEYLIDASALSNMPDKLLLVWDAPPRGFVATIRLEYSNDLAQWDIVEPEATLAEIHFEGRAFSQREIDLPPVHPRYMRLRGLSDTSEVRLVSAQALFAPAAQPPVPLWMPMPGRIVNDAQAQLRNTSVYEFDSAGFFPIDRVRVRWPQRNTLIEAALLSRASINEPWRERYRNALYQLQEKDVVLDNTTILLFPNTDRYWRLEVNDRSGGLGNAKPSLDIGWLPQRLVFDAIGDPPFTLAYGSARVTTPSTMKSLLLSDLEARGALVTPASPGENVVLGGAGRQQPDVPGMAWKTRMVLIASLAGAVVLALFAWLQHRRKQTNVIFAAFKLLGKTRKSKSAT